MMGRGRVCKRQIFSVLSLDSKGRWGLPVEGERGSRRENFLASKQLTEDIFYFVGKTSTFNIYLFLDIYHFFLAIIKAKYERNDNKDIVNVIYCISSGDLDR